MKAVILAGGLGTRFSEETNIKPKPMIEIGGKPILWHIMKIYSHYGINDFIICLGYKGYLIKEYFSNYSLHNSDVTFNLSDNSVNVHSKRAEPWSITLVDTGDNTMTGGRLLRVKDFLGDDDFCFTYGDGLTNSNISSSIEFHRKHKKLATITTCFPPGRFGAITLDGNQVKSFHEKPKGDGIMVNAGFFVLSNEIFQYIKDDSTVWEQEPLVNLSKDNQLMAYKHSGFWRPMDTAFDKKSLEELWLKGNAPWKLW